MSNNDNKLIMRHATSGYNYADAIMELSQFQEISSARHADEGWYACVAYGRKEKAVEIAYLEIRDICEVRLKVF